MKKARVDSINNEWNSLNVTDSNSDSDDESDTGIYTTLSPVTPSSYSSNDLMPVHSSYMSSKASLPGAFVLMMPPDSKTQNMSLYHRQAVDTQLNMHPSQQNYQHSSIGATISLQPPASQSSQPTPPNTIDLHSPPPPQYPTPVQTANPSGGPTVDEQMSASPLPGPSTNIFSVSVDPRQVPILTHLLQPQPSSIMGEKLVNPMGSQMYHPESAPVPPNSLTSRPRLDTPTYSMHSPITPVPLQRNSQLPNIPISSSTMASPRVNSCVLATARLQSGTTTSSQHLPPKSPALSRVNSANHRGICRALHTNQESSYAEDNYTSHSMKGISSRNQANHDEGLPFITPGSDMNCHLPGTYSKSTSTESPQLRRAHIVMPENSSYSLLTAANYQHPSTQPKMALPTSVSQSRSRSQPNLMNDYVNLDPANLGLGDINSGDTGHHMGMLSTCFPGISGLSAWNEMVMRENHTLWMQLKQTNSYQLDLIERRVRQLEAVFDQLVDSHERQCQLDCQIVSQYEAEMARLTLDNDRLRITINRLNLDHDISSRSINNPATGQTAPSMERMLNGKLSLVTHSTNQANVS